MIIVVQSHSLPTCYKCYNRWYTYVPHEVLGEERKHGSRTFENGLVHEMFGDNSVSFSHCFVGALVKMRTHFFICSDGDSLRMCICRYRAHVYILNQLIRTSMVYDAGSWLV